MRNLGRLAGHVWYLVDPKRRRLARRHMQRLGMTPSAAREIFASYGRYWAESFWVRPRRFEQMWRHMTVDGLDNLASACQGGRGVILVLPHTGNWEAAALVALQVDLPLVAVAERLANPLITRWFVSQRGMFGIEIVLTGQGRVGAQLVEAVQDGKGVCLLSDRDLTGRGIEVDFFGEATTLPAGPVSLARKTNAAILPAALYFKDGPGHHTVIGEPLEISHREPASVQVQEMAHRLEDLIRRQPDQWHLVQPNWPSDRT